MGDTGKIGSVVGALVCFAANSLLCRYALGEGRLDAGSWTAVRLGAGAVALLVLANALRSRPEVARRGRDLMSSVALFMYAAC